MAGGGSSYRPLGSANVVGNGRVLFYSLTWLVLVIGLTFMNKGVFKWTSFKYPILLSTVHMVVNWLLSIVVWRYIAPTNEKEGIAKDSGRLIMYFSFLFVLNIAFGNMSVKVSTK